MLLPWVPVNGCDELMHLAWNGAEWYQEWLWQCLESWQLRGKACHCGRTSDVVMSTCVNGYCCGGSLFNSVL